MISCSTKTLASSLLFLIVTSFAIVVHAAPYGPDGLVNRTYSGPDGWAVSVNCKGNGVDDDCKVSALKDGKPTLSIIKSPVLPGVQWYSDIAMIRFPCGSGCRNDLFFSPPNKIDEHSLVAEDAIDVKRKFVVSVESNPLKVYRLFSSSTPVATLHLATSFKQPDIQKLRFERNRLVVWYRNDSGVLKRAMVSVPVT